MELKYIIEICVAIDIAIFGIAYPIIIDKITNIGQKFSSNYLANAFENEFPQGKILGKLPGRSRQITIFEWVLFFTIASFSLLILNLKPLFCEDVWIMQNSAKILIFLLTITLVIIFIIWLDKVALYNGKSTRLLTYIIMKYRKFDDPNNDEYYFKIINEFAIFAIRTQDKGLEETLISFYTDEFNNSRSNFIKPKVNEKSESFENFRVDFNHEFYNGIREIIREVSKGRNEDLRSLESFAVSGVWFMGHGIFETPISNDTYNQLWINVVLISENADFVGKYWSTAHQYFNFGLKRVYGANYILEEKAYDNQKSINQRDKERERFVEFHLALGGLLVYKKNYSALKTLFTYTQQQPPKYVLLPQNMTEIFNWFSSFKNEFGRGYYPTDLTYPFPGLNNLGNSRQVTYYICQYIVLLYLRQFKLNKYYNNENFTGQPNLPSSQVLELLRWKESIEYFKFNLEKVLKNKKLLKIIAIKNKETKILETKSLKFLDILEKSIEKNINEARLNANIDDKKEMQFYINSKDELMGAFEKFDIIKNVEKSFQKEPTNSYGINGIMNLFQKSGFTSGDIPHINADTILSQQIILQSINNDLPNTFLFAAKKRYLLRKDDLVKGINKLNFNPEKDILIAMNLNIYGIKEFEKIENKIVKIPSTGLRNVLFLLPKIDLPIITHKDLETKEQKEHQLGILDGSRKIYASLIDLTLNENSEYRKKWDSNENDFTKELYVQLTIAFITEIMWKASSNVIQINIENSFEEQGIVNEISDLERIE